MPSMTLTLRSSDANSGLNSSIQTNTPSKRTHSPPIVRTWLVDATCSRRTWHDNVLLEGKDLSELLAKHEKSEKIFWNESSRLRNSFEVYEKINEYDRATNIRIKILRECSNATDDTTSFVCNEDEAATLQPTKISVNTTADCSLSIFVENSGRIYAYCVYVTSKSGDGRTQSIAITVRQE